MRYSNIIFNDVVNTDGVALTFFTQGCHHHCKGCFSKTTWDFNGGYELTKDKISELIYCIKNYKYDYICLVGGEPLQNLEVSEFIINLCKKYHPTIKVWCYTGYDMGEISYNKILDQIDVIVCGKFVEDLYDAKLLYMGSSNQKIYKKSESGEWIDTTNILQN